LSIVALIDNTVNTSLRLLQGNRISKSEIENYFSGSEQVIWQAKSDDRNLFFGQNAQLWLSKVTGSSSAN
jgi:hypothetical protein